jgi:hypothetical protein
MGERGSLVPNLCSVRAMDGWRLKNEVRELLSRGGGEGQK